MTQTVTTHRQLSEAEFRQECLEYDCAGQDLVCPFARQTLNLEALLLRVTPEQVHYVANLLNLYASRFLKITKLHLLHFWQRYYYPRAIFNVFVLPGRC